jgi:hypothetical protein
VVRNGLPQDGRSPRPRGEAHTVPTVCLLGMRTTLSEPQQWALNGYSGLGRWAAPPMGHTHPPSSNPSLRNAKRSDSLVAMTLLAVESIGVTTTREQILAAGDLDRFSSAGVRRLRWTHYHRSDSPVTCHMCHAPGPAAERQTKPVASASKSLPWVGCVSQVGHRRPKLQRWARPMPLESRTKEGESRG